MEHMINNHPKVLTKKKPYVHRQCRISYACKIWSMVVVCVFLVIAASALIYFLLMKSPNKQQHIGHLILAKGSDWTAECPVGHVELSERYDCYPENPNVDRGSCESRGCCFLGTASEHHGNSVAPRCVYPENYGYQLQGEPILMEQGLELSLQRLPAPSRFGDDIPVVKVLIEKQTPYRLRIKFYDAVGDRFEVPTPKVPVSPPGGASEEDTPPLYDVSYNSSRVPFHVHVRRSPAGTTVFDTSAGGLTLSHHFLELSTLLPSLHVFGLGRYAPEHFGDLDWKTWPLFSSAFRKGSGVHPMYMCIEDDGSAHGIFLLNSNAMEIKLSPAPAVTFRTLGGILDFYLFMGPTPEDVVTQYNEAVGRPPLPPYWALGLHVGSDSFHSAGDTEKYVQQMQSVDMTMEVIHFGVDVLGLYSVGSRELHSLSNITSMLHDKDQKVIIPVQPAIKVDEALNSMYKIGMKHSAFISDKWGSPLYGEVSGEKVVYADYGKSSCQDWWSETLQKVFSEYLTFDGISMVNDEPLSESDGGINGCMNDDLNRPPYVPSGKVLYSQTICMDANQHWEDEEYAHYYLHNLYGHIMASSTQKAMKSSDKSRKLFTSCSTFAGSGHFVGHWLEGFEGSWELFEPAIRMALDYNIYGIPLVGVKLCSCDGDSELLLRWIQLSLLLPMSGFLHCAPHDLCVIQKLNGDFMHSVQPSINQRYQLLPYLYTLFYRAHMDGSSVLRSLMHEFPCDNATHNMNSQFMWGSALLIAPVIKQGAKKLQYYLPEGIWYRLYSGDMIISKSEWFNETLDSFDRHNPAALFLRAGHIIAVQQPSRTTAESRQTPMKLLVALNATLQAVDELYWDDGSSRDSIAEGKFMLIRFEAAENTLTVDVSTGSKGSRLNFNTAYIHHVQIMGLSDNPKDVSINDYIVISKQRHWNPETKVLSIKGIVIPLEGRTELKWSM